MSSSLGQAKLTANESFVVEHTARGEVADFALQRGFSDKARPRLTANFIRRLMLGQIPGAAILLPGVRIRNAHVEGRLDLKDCLGPGGVGLPALALEDCDLPDPIDVSASRFSRLSIAESRFRELRGDGVVIDGDLRLSLTSPAPVTGDGIATSSVVVIDARIGGSLAASGAQLNNPDGHALVADRARIDGGVFLRAHGETRFEAQGEVRLLGANIGGDLDCSGSRLINPQGYALCADSALVAGRVFLGSSDETRFEARGDVQLLGARIGGDLDFVGADLTASEDGFALMLQGVRIQGTLQVSTSTLSEQNKISGDISLSSAHISELFDDLKVGWGDTNARTWIDLSNVHIDQIDGPGGAASQVKDRVRWLKRNTCDGETRRSHPYSPQPWRQIAAAYERAGDHASARKIRREERREANRHRPWFVQPVFWAFGEQMFGYGHSIARPAVSLLVFWSIGVFGAAVMAASGALVERQAPDKPPLACASAAPALYALDVMIPVLDLGEESSCVPGAAPGAHAGLPTPVKGWAFKLQSPAFWSWAKAIYAILGAALVSLSILAWSGVFRPRAEP